MKKFLKLFGEESKSLLPATIFFFIVFSLVALTNNLIRKESETGVYISFGLILFSSLIMAKVVFIADHLPWVHLFSEKPLIYGTCWKSLFYVVMSILVRLLEHTIRLLFEHKSFYDALQIAIGDVNWMRFWVVQMWLVLLFFIYVAARELIMAMGVQKVRKLFFGRKEDHPER